MMNITVTICVTTLCVTTLSCFIFKFISRPLKSPTIKWKKENLVQYAIKHVHGMTTRSRGWTKREIINIINGDDTLDNIISKYNLISRDRRSNSDSMYTNSLSTPNIHWKKERLLAFGIQHVRGMTTRARNWTKSEIISLINGQENIDDIIDRYNHLARVRRSNNAQFYHTQYQ